MNHNALSANSQLESATAGAQALDSPAAKAQSRVSAREPQVTSRRAGWWIGVALGVANHLLFAVTVYFLFHFLWGTPRHQEARATLSRQSLNALLALQFTVAHSLLLLPQVRSRITRHIPGAFYGTLFCFATCVGLLTAIGGWTTASPLLWSLQGPVRVAIRTAFILTWPALLYSISLTGLGYQTGFTPWWRWVRGLGPERRDFQPTSLYRWFRHPIYLSFLGLVWLTPDVTVDRLILNCIWTVYIYIGSVLKDRRLVFYLGARYRAYMRCVVGYPGILWGPLGRS